MDATETMDAPGSRTEDLLEDTHELDGPDAAAVEPPIHLARCSECTVTVRIEMLSSGKGFILRDADPDDRFGVGENGFPICPNGHGEMAIADDQLKPAPEAFADAQTMLLTSEAEAAGKPVQGSLPGVFPVFNFEGAFKEIVQQARSVERLKSDYDDAKEEAASAKKALDKAAELLMSMTLEFERRRRDKAAEPSATAAAPATAPDRVPCTWEQAHQGETCPVCSGRITADVATADAQQHNTDVDAALAARQVDDVVHALASIDVYVKAAVVTDWTAEARADVLSWANAEFDRRHDDTVTVPERPAVLGRPHVPAEVTGDEAQVCTLCQVVLVAGGEDMRESRHKVTDYIGTDCAGKVVDEGHHYPARGKKKPAAKKPTKGRR